MEEIIDEEIYKVSLSNGMELDCSPGHKWLIQKGNPKHPERCLCEEIETTDLKIGDIIVEAQKKKIKSTNDLEKIVETALKSNQKTILIVIYNNQNQRRYIGVKLD